MNSFMLEIVTPDGLVFSGKAESLMARCADGDVEIMKGHADLFSSLGTGMVRLKADGKTRYASASGGFLSVTKGAVKLVATTFEFSEDIDKQRAERAKEKAERLKAEAKDKASLRIAEAKLLRALNRLNVKNHIT